MAIQGLKPHEQALFDYLERHFDQVMLGHQPVEASLQVMVRMMAGVLATEMGARELNETALTRVVDPYARLLKTWTREAFQFATRRDQGRRN